MKIYRYVTLILNWFLLVFILLSPNVMGQKGIILKGRVENRKSQPVPYASIRVENIKTPGVKRSAHSKQDGTWSIPFIQKGFWKLSVFTSEMAADSIYIRVEDFEPQIRQIVNQESIDILKKGLIPPFKSASFKTLKEINTVLDISSTEVLLQSKKWIYSRSFFKAIDELERFKNDFPNSRYLTNSLYWLGYCNYQLSLAMKNKEDARQLCRKALIYINKLIEKYPESEWADDARILRIEIAHGLFHLGFKKYKKIVVEVVDSPQEYDIHLRLTALDSLMRMDQKRAINDLVKIIYQSRDSEVRLRAILVLAKGNRSKILPILKNLAEKDPDPRVQKIADSWIRRLKSQ